MLKRNSDGQITFHCDTPNCRRNTAHATKSYRRAQQAARRKGWAIGTESDACPEHRA